MQKIVPSIQTDSYSRGLNFIYEFKIHPIKNLRSK